MIMKLIAENLDWCLYESGFLCEGTFPFHLALFIGIQADFKMCEVTFTENKLCSTKKFVCVKIRGHHSDKGNRHTIFFFFLSQAPFVW